jgi:hypothetical protein
MADSSSTHAPAAASEQDAETSEHGTPSQSMSSVQQQTYTQTDELAAGAESAETAGGGNLASTSGEAQQCVGQQQQRAGEAGQQLTEMHTLSKP